MATPTVTPSVESRMVRFLALGDFGTGDEFQERVATRMCRQFSSAPFTHVVTTGDNIYPFGDPRDFDEKFLEPYECLFDEGVRFRATLGNHDYFTGEGRPELEHPAFGMPASYYTWELGPVSFVMLNSEDVNDEQLAWLDRRLEESRDHPWTIVVFHRPLYTAGFRHIDTPEFEGLFADRFSNGGVDLVLNGHDHLYSRATTGNVTYLVTGGGGATLDVCRVPLPDPITECAATLHFVEVEATRTSLTAEVIDDAGRVLDTVTIEKNV